MTMANSIEARVPFLDYRLAEQVALLPPRLKSSGLTTKKLLRSATKSLLPKAIRKGKKRGFTPPLPHWINNELKDYVAGKFSSVNLEKVGILDKKYCNNLLAQHLSGQKDNNREIWTLVALINWTNKFNVSF
jgi:asparagine synthase (glutamine-hydrolysing)